MKNTFGKIVCSLLIAILCFSMVACNVNHPFKGTKLVFDKKYIAENDLGAEKQTYFIFYSDHTGKLERYTKHESSLGDEYSYTISGTVEFAWREADDGSIYLFKTNVTLHEDHDNDSSDIGVPDYPLTVGDEFIALTSPGQHGNTRRYILEDSDLEKSLND